MDGLLSGFTCVDIGEAVRDGESSCIAELLGERLEASTGSSKGLLRSVPGKLQ